MLTLVAIDQKVFFNTAAGMVRVLFNTVADIGYHQSKGIFLTSAGKVRVPDNAVVVAMLPVQKLLMLNLEGIK